MKLMVQQGSKMEREGALMGYGLRQSQEGFPEEGAMTLKEQEKQEQQFSQRGRRVQRPRARAQMLYLGAGRGQPHQDGGLSKRGNWGGRVSGSPGREADERKQT